MKELPIFLLNGFLESGKTSLIKEICENNEQYHNDTTVIIVCEEGEVEYDEAWCKKYDINVVYVEDQSELTPEYMIELEKKYNPERMVIEYNSFYDFDAQEMPEHMVIYQQITMIDASKFSVMFNNMKKIFQKMVEYSSLVVFNRCDGIKELGNYRRSIRSLNQQAQIAFEDGKGNLTSMLDEDLPYDLTKDYIEFDESAYSTWYCDLFDNYEKYAGKTFKFKTFVRDITPFNTLVVGYDVMVCCNEDIQFLGYEAHNNTPVKVKKNDYVEIECTIEKEVSRISGAEAVMLNINKMKVLKKKKPEVLQ